MLLLLERQEAQHPRGSHISNSVISNDHTDRSISYLPSLLRWRRVLTTGNNLVLIGASSQIVAVAGTFPGLRLPGPSRYVAAINSTNSHCTPTGLYVLVSTHYGQLNSSPTPIYRSHNSRGTSQVWLRPTAALLLNHLYGACPFGQRWIAGTDTCLYLLFCDTLLEMKPHSDKPLMLLDIMENSLLPRYTVVGHHQFPMKLYEGSLGTHIVKKDVPVFSFKLQSESSTFDSHVQKHLVTGQREHTFEIDRSGSSLQG
ncbi:hypothetical protein EV702DRAFT_1048188 [Suillus placidus]|uniref:Uncharacterized protein n=1 Tax=Suillus placidus TaxID=48579 RepID=A0A9P6ZNK9_9AGAM|nr:hypothetical protein EV702DRAFT_1048188 [Suillus placidus]